MRVFKSVMMLTVGAFAVGAICNPQTNPLLREFQVGMARRNMKELAAACRWCMGAEERIPVALEELMRGGYLGQKATVRSALTDPFGSRYVYGPPTASEDGHIASAGPDRLFGTPDDIAVLVPHPDERGETE